MYEIPLKYVQKLIKIHTLNCEFFNYFSKTNYYFNLKNFKFLSVENDILISNYPLSVHIAIMEIPKIVSSFLFLIYIFVNHNSVEKNLIGGPPSKLANRHISSLISSCSTRIFSVVTKLNV